MPALAALGDIDLVISAIQDPHDDLLGAALRSRAAHLSVVRMVHNLGPTAMTAALLAKRPVLVQGHWQAGAATFAALASAREFASVERVEMAGLYDLADAAGPMASSDSGAFLEQALARRHGQWVRWTPLEHKRMIWRDDLPGFLAQPMGALDVVGVATETSAAAVRFDLGIADSLGKIGGGRASHDMFVDLWGTDERGAPLARRTVISDALGQCHLTAVGALIGAERLLGLDGAAPPAPGLAFPEAVIDPVRALDRLRDYGVGVETGLPVGH
jgi:hypothetical protein